MPQPLLSPDALLDQQRSEFGSFSFTLQESSSASSEASSATRNTLHNGQLLIASLTTFSKYFHPTHGLYRDHSEIDFDQVSYDGLPMISPEEVEWLIIDLRFVIADHEWASVDQQVSPRSQTRTLPDLWNSPSVTGTSKNVIFTNCYKLSLIGAEYVEATLNDDRAKALVELVFDRLDPRGIMEVEWLTAADQAASALTLNSHLVHPAIAQAGKCWSSAPDVNPLAILRSSEEEDMDMSNPIGVRGEDIGLRCLRIQGGFPMPNPSTDSSTPYALKPDFSFAFKDWIKGGVECLIWGFKGEYSVVCTLGILRHLFKYLAEYFATSGRLPCALLLLQDLNPKVARELQTQDTTAMRRCGTDIFDPELKTALSDVVFLESDTTEAGAQIIERLWDDGEAIDEDCGRDRALRRLKADIAANDRALRRLTAEANGVTSTPAPMLFTRGPPSHIRVRDAEASPAPTFLCSPTSSRSHSYSSMHHQASSNSASTASLNTLEDISDESAVPQIRPVGIADDNDSVPKSSEMLSKPLSPTENLRSRYHELL